MIASDHLNLHFHCDICFIYVCRIVAISYVVHNVFFFHVKALILITVVRYQSIVVCFANSLLLQSWDFWPKEHVHLSGLQILALWKTDWFNRKVGLPRKHTIKNEHLTALWLKVVDLTQAYGKFMQQGYCIKTISVERQNLILSLPPFLPPLLSHDSVFLRCLLLTFCLLNDSSLKIDILHEDWTVPRRIFR